MITCRPCHYGKHDKCSGNGWDRRAKAVVVCECWFGHDYSEPDPELPDPYHTDAAEDAYYDTMIGERWGGEQP